MPTYEYECVNCSNREEKYRRIKARDWVVACSVCRHPCRRVVSRTNFALKGDGWYGKDTESQTPGDQ